MHGLFGSPRFFVFGVGVWLALSPCIRAQLSVEPATVDLGRRAQEQVASAEVKLTNPGAQPVEIKSVAADCSCTAGTPEKRVLGPGESTTMKITFETRSFQGEIHRRVMLDTSAGAVAIPVKAFVSAFENWGISPFPAIIAPSLKGQAMSGEVSLSYTGKADAKITQISTNAEWLNAAVAREDAGKFTVALTKAATAPAGNYNVKVLVVTTDPVTPQITFNVFVPVTSTVRVDPTPVVFPPGKVGQPSLISAQITGWASATDPRLELQFGEIKNLRRKNDSYSFQIAITPQAPGAFTQLMRVYAEGRLETEIPVIIRVQP